MNFQEEYKQVSTGMVEQNIRKYNILVREISSFIGIEIFNISLIKQYQEKGYKQEPEHGIFTENYFTIKKDKNATLEETAKLIQHFIDIKAVFGVGKQTEWHPQGVVSYLRDEKKMVNGIYYYCTWYRPFGYWIIKI